MFRLNPKRQPKEYTSQLKGEEADAWLALESKLKFTPQKGYALTARRQDGTAAEMACAAVIKVYSDRTADFLCAIYDLKKFKAPEQGNIEGEVIISNISVIKDKQNSAWLV